MQRTFVCHKPKTLLSPLIYNSPHSGRVYSQRFLRQASLNLKEIRVSEDFYVEQLLDSVPASGSFLLEACFPRCYVDVNRSSNDLDHHLISKLDHCSMNPKTAAGLGVIPRVVGDGIDIYDKKLSLEEVKFRLDKYYFPYHRELKRLIKYSVEKFGMAILLDVHSMPHNCIDHLVDNKASTPQIVVGDCFGSSCSSTFSQTIFESFVSEGFKVRRNTPFSGGFITRNYGAPSQNVQAIQIEIDRSLYMDESNFKLHSGFPLLKHKLENIIISLAKNFDPKNFLFHAAE